MTIMDNLTKKVEQLKTDCKEESKRMQSNLKELREAKVELPKAIKALNNLYEGFLEQMKIFNKGAEKLSKIKI